MCGYLHAVTCLELQLCYPVSWVLAPDAVWGPYHPVNNALCSQGRPEENQLCIVGSGGRWGTEEVQISLFPSLHSGLFCPSPTLSLNLCWSDSRKQEIMAGLKSWKEEI